jgi:hypothetical protein
MDFLSLHQRKNGHMGGSEAETIRQPRRPVNRAAAGGSASRRRRRRAGTDCPRHGVRYALRDGIVTRMGQDALRLGERSE